MRPARLTVVLLSATLLAGTVGQGTLAAPLDTPDAPVVVVDQAASPPVPTTAFGLTDCPVEITIPEGSSAVCGQVTVPQRHADPSEDRDEGLERAAEIRGRGIGALERQAREDARQLAVGARAEAEEVEVGAVDRERGERQRVPAAPMM